MTPSRFPLLEGKTAFITGSTRGIGRAIAEGFQAAGARVILHGRSSAGAAGLAGPVQVAADLVDPSAVVAMASQVRELCGGRLDVLVNNAGFEVPMAIGNMDWAVFDKIVQVNLRAAVQLTEELLDPLTVSGSSSVINVTSIHETTAAAQNGPYCMAKAALAMFTKIAAIELAPRGIRVNNLAPGAIATDMNREVVEGLQEGFREWIPSGRVGECAEMVGPALFLASEASSYVTGTTLTADGGYSANLLRYRVGDVAARHQ